VMSPTVSSRTPEGSPNYCPVCGNTVCVEPSELWGDAPCPNCGHLLFFAKLGDGLKVFPLPEAQNVKERVIGRLAKILGVSRDKISSFNLVTNDLGADSLDTVELVMALEEELEAK
jgi:acyl carrier protein